MTSDTHPKSAPLLPALTIGFGIAVAMAAVGFLTHLPVARIPTEVVGGLMLVTLLGGGVIAGRCGGWKLGAMSGLVAGIVILLVLGALIAKPAPGEGVRPDWPVLLGGWLVAATIIGAIGGLLGSKGRPLHPNPDRSLWLGRFALVAAASALPVLLSGGLVTSAEAGLAVPDWPTSFGANMFLFPLSKMTGGIYFEHAHRLFGSLVGVTVMALLVCTLIYERRRWVKFVAIGAFVAVCAQGVLGGIGVTAAKGHSPTTTEATAALPAPADVPDNYATRTDTAQSRAMRMVHGITGQLTFGYLCLLAAFLGPRWSREPRALPYDGALRLFTASLLVGLILQLSIGAGLRHFGHIAFMHSHVTVAVLVLVIAGLTGSRASARAEEASVPIVRRLGKAVVHTVGLQVVLGLVTLLRVLPYDGRPDPADAIVLATAHQAIGAVLLGLTVLLFAWTRRTMAGRA